MVYHPHPPPPQHMHRSKSVSVERAVGGGIGGRLGNSDEGGDKDTQNDSGKYVAVKNSRYSLKEINP